MNNFFGSYHTTNTLTNGFNTDKTVTPNFLKSLSKQKNCKIETSRNWNNSKSDNKQKRFIIDFRDCRCTEQIVLISDPAVTMMFLTEKALILCVPALG